MKRYVWAIILGSSAAHAAETAARSQAQPLAATLRVDAGKPAAHRIPRYITGKFCEHLGSNIYNGMDAQILRNPTLATFPIWTGRMSPDGVALFHNEPEPIAKVLRGHAARQGWPQSGLDQMRQTYDDALASWWVRAGSRDEVETSPDTGPYGGRAQRIAVHKVGSGIAQWTGLPLHRTRRFELEILARSPELKTLTVSFFRQEATEPVAHSTIDGLATEWKTLRGSLQVPDGAPADEAYQFVIAADAPGQVVLARVGLRPADHVGGADPDVVRLLKESKLPILRWPGGNFVSGYHWEDGIGPLDARPTKPNYAWGAVETHHFGTHEFIAFCQAVGCEPMICINGGDGTPAEAARWVEYCNGPADSPMGRRRAANGHPEPFNIRHWEIGNELWGRWQYHWTTAAGYVDRFAQFRRAMLAADPSITLYACGAPVFWGKAWNDTLIKGAAGSLQIITDHPLIGGDVAADADPLDVYRDFMAVPDVMAQKWRALEQDMRAAGIKEPRLAVTELQMFAGIGRTTEGRSARLNHHNLTNPRTLGEALYDVLFYHRAIELAPFVELVTHSATVNHGGGLHKERERVYPNPCHHAQAAFADFAGATPVAVALESPREKAPLVLPDLKKVTSQAEFPALDALAALADNGDLLLSIVHRGTAGPIRLAIETSGFAAKSPADVRTLSAAVPWAANSVAAPNAVAPKDSTVESANGRLQLDLIPYSWVRIRLKRGTP
jgi:alpha-N-arabinofuranosidase